jgi:hypothetical protein
MLDFHNWQMAAFLYCTAGSIYCTYNNSEIGSELFFYFYLQHTNRCLKIMRGDKTNSPSSDNYNYIRLRFFGSAASICSVLLPALHGRDLPGRLGCSTAAVGPVAVPVCPGSGFALLTATIFQNTEVVSCLFPRCSGYC